MISLRGIRTASPFVANDAAPLAWRPFSIDAAGVRLAAFAAGADHAEARVVVLLHGLGHWSDGAWGRLVPRLDPSLRYIALDLPGFGESEKPTAAYDLPFFRHVLDGAVAALELERFTLAGHSLGGFLAADYAGEQRSRVERLVLISPAGFARTPRHLFYALASGALRRLIVRRPSRSRIERLLRHSVVDAAVLLPHELERFYAQAQNRALRDAFASVYASALHAFAQRFALHTGFARFRGPVLCAWGAHDRYIPPAALRDVLRVYPHAETLILERSGHQPMVEEPLRLANALRRFLA